MRKKRRIHIPRRLNRTLRAAIIGNDPELAFEEVQRAPVYTKQRRRALRVWLRLVDNILEVRRVFRFAEPNTRFEHQAVVKWVRLAETEGELIEVLAVVRGLAHSKTLERRVLRRLRTFGYRDWWEVVRDFFRSLSSARKLA